MIIVYADLCICSSKLTRIDRSSFISFEVLDKSPDIARIYLNCIEIHQLEIIGSLLHLQQDTRHFVSMELFDFYQKRDQSVEWEEKMSITAKIHSAVGQ